MQANGRKKEGHLEDVEELSFTTAFSTYIQLCLIGFLGSSKLFITRKDKQRPVAFCHQPLNFMDMKEKIARKSQK